MVFLVYIWVFFPNSPVSRLGPQELQTVFFLSLCTYMVALLLTRKENRKRTNFTGLQYGIFCLGYVGLATTKEVNVPVLAWLLLSYYAIPMIAGRRDDSKFRLGGIPLVCIFFFTLYKVYCASMKSGTGYGHAVSLERSKENSTEILVGLFQVDTSLLITAGLAILLAILLWTLITKRVKRQLDAEIVFILFLLGQFMSLYFILSVSWGVSLRYWYVLIPVFATMLAFSVKFILEIVNRRSRILMRATVMTVASFITFFIAVNYYNFLWQTILQHSLRHAEAKLLSEITRLYDIGEDVQIPELDLEYIHTLRGYRGFLTRFFNRQYNKPLRPVVPKPDQSHYTVYFGEQACVMETHYEIDAQMDYSLLSYAYKLADILQEGQPIESTDMGSSPPTQYRWTICRTPSDVDGYVAHLVKDLGEPIIRSLWDVYIHKGELVYIKNSCNRQDIDVSFFPSCSPSR